MSYIWKCVLFASDWDADEPICGKDAVIWFQAQGGPVLGVCETCSPPFLNPEYIDERRVVAWTRDEVLALEIMSS